MLTDVGVLPVPGGAWIKLWGWRWGGEGLGLGDWQEMVAGGRVNRNART